MYNILELFLILVGILGFGFWILSVFTSLGRGPEKFILTKPLTFSDENFLRVVEGVSHTTFTSGALPQILNNGDEFFSALLKDIENAKHTIHFTTFILRPNDPIGKEILQALKRKSKQGVIVRLLLDSSGSDKFTGVERRELEAVGIQVVFFRPLKFGILTRYHRRNHCRAFVIDGKIGYTGGSAIGQEWTGRAQNHDHWRDMMFRVTDVQARALQHIFCSLWLNMSGQVLVGENIYPPIESSVNDSQWISFLSSPALETSLFRNVYWVSCMAAKETIYIQNSYFLPTPYMRQALTQKSEEGVKVVLMLPNSANDEKVVYYAGRFFYERLLRAGIKIYEFQTTMLHAKTFLADGCWSLIGSANLDTRSEELNDENILGILSKTFGEKMHQQFNQDLGQCKEITLDEWKKRSLWERCLECTCILLGHQL
jgi:cardiolipin synthase